MKELKRCRKQMIRIINLIDKRDTLLTRLGAHAIRYQHDRIQVSPSDRHTEIMAEIADIDTRIQAARTKLRQVRMIALDQIDPLPNASVRYVLMLYYTEFCVCKNGRLGVWSAKGIIHDTGLSDSWVYKILRFDLTGH